MTGSGAVTATAPAVRPDTIDGGNGHRDTADRDTAARLDQTAGRLLRRLRPYRAGALTPSQSSMLHTVRDHGPLSLADLAAREGVRAPTASRAVDLLEQTGLLRRRSDPADGRRQLIDLDGDAMALLEQRAGGAAEVLAAVLATLRPADRSAIERALPALEELVAAISRHLT